MPSQPSCFPKPKDCQTRRGQIFNGDPLHTVLKVRHTCHGGVCVGLCLLTSTLKGHPQLNNLRLRGCALLDRLGWTHIPTSLATHKLDSRPAVNMPLHRSSHGRPKHGSRAPTASNPAPVGWDPVQGTINPRLLSIPDSPPEVVQEETFAPYSYPVSSTHPATYGNPAYAAWSYANEEPSQVPTLPDPYSPAAGVACLAEGV